MSTLCKGYMIRRGNQQTGVSEVLFAVMDDGSIFSTGFIAPSDSFCEHSYYRYPHGLPADAEYIGNYPKPANRTV